MGKRRTVNAVARGVILSRAGESREARPTRLARALAGLFVCNRLRISAWLKNHQGERPLKHWKEIHVYEVKSEVGGWKKCLIGGETGDQEVFLANIPAPVQEFLDTVKSQADAIENEQAAIEQEQVRIRRARANAPIDATTDGSGFVKVQAYYRQLDIDDERLSERKDALVKLNATYRGTLTKAGDKTLTLAMFTGQKYGGLDVWDCGRR